MLTCGGRRSAGARPNLRIGGVGVRYRRAVQKGGTFFFTIVTYHRRPLFTTPANVDLLRQSFRHVRSSHPFILEAAVILPDHLHCVLILPTEDLDFSTRVRLIKKDFSRHFAEKFERTVIPSRKKKSEVMVWQRRFWEHLIRDDTDLRRHVEYIHYNPLKHGLTSSPREWPYSSFYQYVRRGFYSADWGGNPTIDIIEDIQRE